MNKFGKHIIYYLVSLCHTFFYAQNTDHTVSIDIPEVALLSIYKSTNTHALDIISHINEAGEDLTFFTPQNEIWINYTSIIGSRTEPSRSVFMQITDGNVPTGFDLVMTVSKDAGQGNGKMGIPMQTTIISTNQPKQVIDQIGSAYTGAGYSKGHQVIYAIQKNTQYPNFWLANNNSATALQITYTLSDN